jgi:ABC-type branched-subunit amino acid transport system substrate-binding protein
MQLPMSPAFRLAALVGLAALVVAPLGSAQTRRQRRELLPAPAAPLPGQPLTPVTPARPNLPRLALGALLPPRNPAAWYAQDIRGGLELAISEVTPKPSATGSPPGPAAGPAASGGETQASPPAGGDPPVPGAGPGDRPPGPPAAAAAGAGESLAPGSRFQLAVEALDVLPLDVKDAVTDFERLVAAGARVVFTGSPTPTLAVYPIAASRDILLVHLGLPTDRFPPASRTLLQVRPSVPARTAVLAAYAWTRGIRRLALVASGDEFGRAVRATLSARWRERGTPLVAEESLTLDAPDVRSRLVRLTRQGPEAIALGFQGRDLGELVRRLREAGYQGLLLALDDDRTVLLAAGPEISNLEILSDAFVPEPDTLGARFATAFEQRHHRPPSRHAAAAYDVASFVGRSAQRMLEEGRELPRTGGALRATILAGRTFPSVFGGQLTVRDDGTLDRPLALFSTDKGTATFLRYVDSSGRPATGR